MYIRSKEKPYFISFIHFPFEKISFFILISHYKHLVFFKEKIKNKKCSVLYIWNTIPCKFWVSEGDNCISARVVAGVTSSDKLLKILYRYLVLTFCYSAEPSRENLGKLVIANSNSDSHMPGMASTPLASTQFFLLF